MEWSNVALILTFVGLLIVFNFLTNIVIEESYEKEIPLFEKFCKTQNEDTFDKVDYHYSSSNFPLSHGLDALECQYLYVDSFEEVQKHSVYFDGEDFYEWEKNNKESNRINNEHEEFYTKVCEQGLSNKLEEFELFKVYFVEDKNKVACATDVGTYFFNIGGVQ